jgi:hypothetical protein
LIDPAELERLLSALESDRVERTESLNNTVKFCKAICAFANDMPGHRLPGYLCLGVDKNGAPTSAAIDERSRDGQYVFCAADGSMLTHAQTRWPLKRALKNAGIRHIGWHALRHSFASHLVMRGAPIKSVQELLGHCSIEMTMRYAHLSPDVRRDAVKLLDVREPVRLTWTTSRGVVLHIALPQPMRRQDRVHGTRLGQGDPPQSPAARRVRWARRQDLTVRQARPSMTSSRHIRGTWRRPARESRTFSAA